MLSAKCIRKVMVSIIVPVYNTSKYLRQCVESVLTQSYNNWELLLINDGSTDNSGTICDMYSSQDNRIKSIHKDNSGVSNTRNIGLDFATGKYVIFLDSDDYWCDSMILEKLVNLADKYDIDIVRGEYKAVNEDGEDLFYAKTRKINYSRIYDSAYFIENIINGEFFLVLALIKKDAIGGCRFNTNQIFLEDMRFYSQLMLQDLRCMYLPHIFYAYRKNILGVSNRPNVKKLQDSFNMCSVFNELSLRASDTELRKYYRRYSVMMYYWTLDTLSEDPYYIDRINIIKALALMDLREKVLNWGKEYKVCVPIEVHVPTWLGVILFRFRHKIGSYVRKIKLFS